MLAAITSVILIAVGIAIVLGGGKIIAIGIAGLAALFGIFKAKGD